MKLLSLAARNLARNMRRTVITLAAIAFGLSMIHLMINLQTGQYRDMITAGISTLAGHVVVQAEGYQEEKDADLVVTDADAVTEMFSTTFPDAVVAPRMFIGGLLNSPTNSVGVALSGGIPSAESAVQDLDDKVKEGTWLEDDDPRGLLIGAGLAKSLGVGVGDKVVYMGQHGDAEDMTSKLFRVKGIFKTGAAELDGFVALAHLDATRELYGAGDVAHQVTLHLPDPDTSDAATATSKEGLAGRDGIEVLSWQEAIPEIGAMIELDRSSGDIFLTILGLIVTMGVLNTVLMSALERTREFGVMLAIGMRPVQIARVILLEGALLGVLGALLGLVGGLLISYPLVVYGLDYTEYLGGESFESGGVVVSAIMKGEINPVRMMSYTVGAVVFTTLAAIYPAIHVARLKPVDAMRHV
ncbi:MAG: FtsX-like permease family protein [Myxococcales bacterium]|nr:FtsX-like permease family protein [Myxococcales bacterium]